MSKVIDVNLIIPTKDNTKLLSKLLNTSSYDVVTNQFDAGGLYSQEIFGVIGTPNRNSTFSYLELNTKIIHPFIYDILTSMSKLYNGILSGKKYAKFENGDFVKSDEIEGSTGYGFFISKIYDLKIPYEKEYSSRGVKVRDFEKYRDRKELTFDRYLVLPAGLREPEVDDTGRLVEDEINDLYRALFNISLTFKNLDLPDSHMSVMDTSRLRLQTNANAIYNYLMDMTRGKHKFINENWAKSSVTNSTGNVLTSIPPNTKDMDDPACRINTPNHTVVGVYQYSAAAYPFTLHHFKNITAKIFSVDGMIKCLDLKNRVDATYKVNNKVIEKWTTTDGIRDILNKLQDSVFRDSDVAIDGKIILGKIDNGNVITLVDTMDGLDQSVKVTPLTFGELFYIIGLFTSEELVGTLTRYPITEQGSVYPTFISLQSTLKYRSVRVNFNGSVLDGFKYPIKGEIWTEALSVHYSRLAGLGADFDGDKVYLTLLYESESIKEAKAVMSSKRMFLSPVGKPLASLISSITDKVIKHIVRGV